jgi:hypothetical protein
LRVVDHSRSVSYGSDISGVVKVHGTQEGRGFPGDRFGQLSGAWIRLARRLLLLALGAFNAKPRFAVPSERTDSYAIAARLGRWVGSPGDPGPSDLYPSGGPLFRSARRRP